MSIAWLAFILSAIVALGNFADFLIGTKGQRRLKDRLIAWYLELSESDWSKFVKIAARATADYVNRTFGPHFFTPRFLVRACSLSFLVSSLLLVAALSIAAGSLEKGLEILFATRFFRAVPVILVANCAIDLMSLAITRSVMKHVTVSTSKLRTLGVLLVVAGIAYVAVALAVLLTVPSTIVGLTLKDAELPDPLTIWRRLIMAKVSEAFSSPWDAKMTIGGINFSVFSIAAAFGAWFHILVLSSSYLLWLSRPVTQKPILLLVTRLEEAPKGLFTTLGIALAAIVGLIAAYQKASG
jgi:hypothetical protein